MRQDANNPIGSSMSSPASPRSQDCPAMASLEENSAGNQR